MGNLKLALLNIKKNFKNAKELKTSFIISVIGMAINNVAFLVIWYYFGKTVGEINGWTAMDIFGLYGLNCIPYGIVIALFSGILDIPKYITTGNFDKYLLTPKNILVKVSTSSITTSAFGDMLFGIVCFIVYAVWAKLSLFQLLIAFLMLLEIAVIIYSFVLICMSISFYLMDGHNVSQGVYQLFLGNSLYHGGAFTGVLKFIFMFIVPSLLVGAIPIEILKDITVAKLLFMLLAAIFWFIVSVKFFYKSLKKYESNNLFGFGS